MTNLVLEIPTIWGLWGLLGFQLYCSLLLPLLLLCSLMASICACHVAVTFVVYQHSFRLPVNTCSITLDNNDMKLMI